MNTLRSANSFVLLLFALVVVLPSSRATDFDDDPLAVSTFDGTITTGDPSEWTSPESYDYFGLDGDMNDRCMFIGAARSQREGENGRVYVYSRKRNEPQWSFEHLLTPTEDANSTDIAVNEDMGFVVSADGDFMIVGGSKTRLVIYRREVPALSDDYDEDEYVARDICDYRFFYELTIPARTFHDMPAVISDGFFFAHKATAASPVISVWFWDKEADTFQLSALPDLELEVSGNTETGASSITYSAFCAAGDQLVVVGPDTSAYAPYLAHLYTFDTASGSYELVHLSFPDNASATNSIYTTCSMTSNHLFITIDGLVYAWHYSGSGWDSLGVMGAAGVEDTESTRIDVEDDEMFLYQDGTLTMYRYTDSTGWVVDSSKSEELQGVIEGTVHRIYGMFANSRSFAFSRVLVNATYRDTGTVTVFDDTSPITWAPTLEPTKTPTEEGETYRPTTSPTPWPTRVPIEPTESPTNIPTTLAPTASDGAFWDFVDTVGAAFGGLTRVFTLVVVGVLLLGSILICGGLYCYCKKKSPPGDDQEASVGDMESQESLVATSKQTKTKKKKKKRALLKAVHEHISKGSKKKIRSSSDA